MTWTTFKTNWFSIALVLLVLIAIFRGETNRSFFKYFAGERSSTSSFTKMEPAAFSLASDQRSSDAKKSEIDHAEAQSFIKRFAPVAKSERKKFGIPASILLASAFLNSSAGQNESAVSLHNFFATPCTEYWEGPTATINGQCLRKYETPWESWRDYSIFLSSQSWYGSLKQSAGKNWGKWANGLNNKEISPVSNFGDKLSEVIAYYRLYEFDQS